MTDWEGELARRQSPAQAKRDAAWRERFADGLREWKGCGFERVGCECRPGDEACRIAFAEGYADADAGAQRLARRMSKSR